MARKTEERDRLYWKIQDLIYENVPENEIKSLLDKISPEDYKHIGVIFFLIGEHKLNLLDYLYKKNMPFDYTLANAANALHIASAINGSFDAVKFLVERNIFTDINAKTDQNETPFLLAVMYEHGDIVEYFLEHFKPDLSISTTYGDTAFTLAKKSGNKKILAMLDRYNSSK